MANRWNYVLSKARLNRDSLPGYSTDADADELYPSEGRYSIVCIDRFKATDDPEFIRKLKEFDTCDDVVLPAEKHGYTYYVYTAEGETYTRATWPPTE